MVLVLQTYALVKFGAEASLARESAVLDTGLGPVISALMATGCAGSALTAQIGIMRITSKLL
jgi:phospholipid/cholesterol/gamma-HCH transport system permease protein